MPCSGVHLLTAGRALTAASRGGPPLPFPVDDPECRASFLHGALGPDMGFVPGADRFVSEVSHYVQSVDLARTLVQRASTGPEAGFAWGWVTMSSRTWSVTRRWEGMRKRCGATGRCAVKTPQRTCQPPRGMEVGLDRPSSGVERASPGPPTVPTPSTSLPSATCGESPLSSLSVPGGTVGTHLRSRGDELRRPRRAEVLLDGAETLQAPRNRSRGWCEGSRRVGSAPGPDPPGRARGLSTPMQASGGGSWGGRRLADRLPRTTGPSHRGWADNPPNHNLETGAPDEARYPPRPQKTALRWPGLRNACRVSPLWQILWQGPG